VVHQSLQCQRLLAFSTKLLSCSLKLKKKSLSLKLLRQLLIGVEVEVVVVVKAHDRTIPRGNNLPQHDLL
jgi:hypothetical protein